MNAPSRWPPQGWKINNPDWPSGEGEHLVRDDEEEPAKLLGERDRDEEFEFYIGNLRMFLNLCAHPSGGRVAEAWEDDRVSMHELLGISRDFLDRQLPELKRQRDKLAVALERLVKAEHQYENDTGLKTDDPITEAVALAEAALRAAGRL